MVLLVPWLGSRMVEHQPAMQGIAGSSPGCPFLQKTAIISWYLKFTLQSESDCKGGNVTKEFKLMLESVLYFVIFYFPRISSLRARQGQLHFGGNFSDYRVRLPSEEREWELRGKDKGFSLPILLPKVGIFNRGLEWR